MKIYGFDPLVSIDDVRVPKTEAHRLFGVTSGDNKSKGKHFALLQSSDINPFDPFFEPCDLFRVDVEQFLAVGRAKRPRNPIAAVTGFSGWVHSLYASKSDERKLKAGKEAESSILMSRRGIYKDDKIWSPCSPGWSLVHNGLKCKIQPTDSFRHFDIPGLVVNGQCLRACPDLIYRNSSSGAVIIVEIKFSYAAIPENLWPDIWAQLWAYSYIPEFQSARSVALVGEVWADNFYGHSRLLSEDDYDAIGLFDDVYLRKVVVRDPRRAAFDRFYNELFKIYSGGK